MSDCRRGLSVYLSVKFIIFKFSKEKHRQALLGNKNCCMGVYVTHGAEVIRHVRPHDVRRSMPATSRISQTVGGERQRERKGTDAFRPCECRSDNNITANTSTACAAASDASDCLLCCLPAALMRLCSILSGIQK